MQIEFVQLQSYKTSIGNKFITFYNKTEIFYSIMGEISPIPAKGLDPELFKIFKNDLEFILGLITQEELGKEMGIKARSNINKYIKGTTPVTKGFISKFYRAWRYRINMERSKPEHSVSEESAMDQAKQPTLADILAILHRIERKIDRQAGPPDEKN